MGKSKPKTELQKGRENSLNKLLGLDVPKKILERFLAPNPKIRKRIGKNEFSWISIFHSVKKSANTILPAVVKDKWISNVTNSLKRRGDDFIYLHTGHSSMEALVRELVDFHLSIGTKIRNVSNYAHIDVASNAISQVKGQLLHKIIENCKPLWTQLRKMGNFMVDIANSPEGRKNLVDAKGKSVMKLLGKLKFNRVKRASNIKIKFKEAITLPDGRKIEEVQFVDNVLISHTGDVLDQDAFVHLTTALESKTVGAASGFSEQISSMLGRAGDSNVKSISMNVEGVGDVEINPKQLVFNTMSLDQVAVTTMSKRQLELQKAIQSDFETAVKNGKLEKVFNMSNFKVSSTDKNGGAAFLRVELPINDRYLERVSRAVVTRAP